MQRLKPGRAGAAPDLNWGNETNWGGDALEEPETTLLSFDNAGTGKNLLDTNRTLNAGLTVANTTNVHTMDLGGNTLTLNGGTLNVGNTVIGSAATFQNGTLVLGSGTAVDVTGGKDANGAASTLNIGGGITAANLRNVSVGSGIAYSGGGYSYGTLDLRNAVPTLRTFAISGNLSIGVDGWSGGTGASGTLYLNDSGGVITNLQVGGNFSLWTGSIVLNSGAAVTIGSSGTPVTMDVGKAHGSQTVSFAPTGPFTAYLSTVTIGAIQWVGFLTGTLDLRNARPTQSTFACGNLNIGSDSGVGSANGSLYLNDGGGVITALQVATNLNFYIGTLTFNTGTSVTIGNGASARGKLALGNNGTATLAPTGGTFTAYLSTANLGQTSGTGTLNLTNANLSAFDVSGTATIGASGSGKGVVYLGGGNASFTNLAIGANTTATGNLLQLKGTTLTIGNSSTNVFNIAAGKGSLVLDFNNPVTSLSVYGDWQASGPATNIPTYLANGRLRYVLPAGKSSNDVVVTVADGYTRLGWGVGIDNAAGASAVSATSAALNGTLYTPAGTSAVVTVFWGTNDAGMQRVGWQSTNTFGVCSAGALTTNLTAIPAGRYWYRFYATNGYGEAWGDPASPFEVVGSGLPRWWPTARPRESA